MEIQLYDRNLSSPVFVKDLTPLIHGGVFSTKLHGGFYTFSFKLKTSTLNTWEWVDKRVFYRIIIKDELRTLFEGRVEDVAVTKSGVEITAYGFYANLGDVPYATAYNDHADDVIKAVLTANCTQINSDQSNIDALDITVTSAAGDEYLDIYPRDIVEKTLEFSDSTAQKWYFAIWEDRKPHLHSASLSTITWYVDMKDFVSFKLKHVASQIWNSCYAVYEAGGAVARTADSSDASSIAKYGLTRKYVVPNVGAQALATAQAARAAYLAAHKNIMPRLTNMVLGNEVMDSKGVICPSAWVRAGDVLRIRDLIAPNVNLSSTEQDALRTFYLIETSYDMDKGQLSIIPDTENMRLTSVLNKQIRKLRQRHV